MQNSEEWGYTQIIRTNYTYRWTIDNILLLGENEKMKELKSPIFSSGCTTQSKWCLIISLEGDEERNKKYSLFLSLVSTNQNEIFANFKLSILNNVGEQTNVLKSTQNFRFIPESKWGCADFIKRNLLMDKSRGLLHDKQLKVLCEISYVKDFINVAGQYQFKVPEKKLSEDFKGLLESGNMHDVILKVDGRELKAHKAILAARSPVFAAMFKHDFTEKEGCSVDITDIDYDVVEEMLRFIYTGDAPQLNSMASRLLEAADKYALERLSVQCDEALSLNLKAENAAEILMLADKLNRKTLKFRVITFIYQNDEVLKTDSWQKLLSQNPQLDLKSALAFMEARMEYGPPAKRPRNSSSFFSKFFKNPFSILF